MSPSPSDPPPPAPSPASTRIALQASAWLARRDRGLTPAEQDEYLQWLAADPRHAAAMADHAAALERLMSLYEWQPGQITEPNPDLFAPRRRRHLPFVALSLAAAAAFALCTTLWWRSSLPTSPASDATVAQPPKSYLRVNERHALPDGSLVELKDGSRLVTDFSAVTRRVRLVGEAHFTVAKDPARPFVVDAEGVSVRAVGTAFNVRIGSDVVEVLVTEGSVHVLPPAPVRSTPPPASVTNDPAPPVVSARQRAIVTLGAPAPAQVSDVTPAQLDESLAWQAPRLQFLETPLAVAVAEFNQRNRTQLVLGDPTLRPVPIGGTFRVANVEGFVRLLEVTLDVRATPRGEHEIVLTRAK